MRVLGTLSLLASPILFDMFRQRMPPLSHGKIRALSPGSCARLRSAPTALLFRSFIPLIPLRPTFRHFTFRQPVRPGWLRIVRRRLDNFKRPLCSRSTTYPPIRDLCMGLPSTVGWSALGIVDHQTLKELANTGAFDPLACGIDRILPRLFTALTM